jgi:hypothetical protein
MADTIISQVLVKTEIFTSEDGPTLGMVTVGHAKDQYSINQSVTLFQFMDSNTGETFTMTQNDLWHWVMKNRG